MLLTLTLFPISNFYYDSSTPLKCISQYLAFHILSSAPANMPNCTSADLYGHDFEALLGGSICLNNNG